MSLDSNQTLRVAGPTRRPSKVEILGIAVGHPRRISTAENRRSEQTCRQALMRWFPGSVQYSNPSSETGTARTAGRLSYSIAESRGVAFTLADLIGWRSGEDSVITDCGVGYIDLSIRDAREFVSTQNQGDENIVSYFSYWPGGRQRCIQYFISIFNCSVAHPPSPAYIPIPTRQGTRAVTTPRV